MTLDIKKLLINIIKKQMSILHYEAEVNIFKKENLPEKVSTKIIEEFGENYLLDSDMIVFYKGQFDEDGIEKLYSITNKAFGEDANRMTIGDFKKFSLNGKSEVSQPEPDEDYQPEPDSSLDSDDSEDDVDDNLINDIVNDDTEDDDIEDSAESDDVESDDEIDSEDDGIEDDIESDDEMSNDEVNEDDAEEQDVEETKPADVPLKPANVPGSFIFLKITVK